MAGEVKGRSTVDLVFLGFSEELQLMQDGGKGSDPKGRIYRPVTKAEKESGKRPLYVNLWTPEMPDLREQFDAYLAEIGYEASEYTRWLLSYAIVNRLAPDDH